MQEYGDSIFRKNKYRIILFLAAAANHTRSQAVLQETFLLSNICPQHPALNRKLWKKLEFYTRSLAKNNLAAYVCSGPLYLPKEINGKLIVQYEVLGIQQVAVPTHFFKIILIDKKGKQPIFKLTGCLFEIFLTLRLPSSQS